MSGIKKYTGWDEWQLDITEEIAMAQQLQLFKTKHRAKKINSSRGHNNPKSLYT